MTTLGLIGSGNIGSAVARLAVAAGLDVVVSNSRGPGTLAALVAELGRHARAATPAEAAQAGDLVVVTVPLNAYRQLPSAALAGKIIIDTMNYYPDRDGHIAELDSGTMTSSALVQQHLPDSRVVKAFNNIDHRHLFTSARPAGDVDRSALPIAGDDNDAKARVTWLLNMIGYDAVDAGVLADSWRSEPGTLVYVQPYLSRPPRGLSPDMAQRWYFETPGAPVPADRVTELVETAVRVVASEARATATHAFKLS